MKCNILCATVALCLLAGSARAATFYEADFTGSQGITHTTSSPAPSAPHSVSGPNWTFSYSSNPTTDTSANFARAAGDRFETEDWGGEAEVVSDPIDVSSYDLVDIEWDGLTVGSQVFNSSTEFFEWFYMIDASPAVSMTTTADGSLDKLYSSVDVSTSSSLKVGFRWRVDGAGDGFDMFGMTVSGEAAIVPEPASVALFVLAFIGAGLFRRRK